MLSETGSFFYPCKIFLYKANLLMIQKEHKKICELFIIKSGNKGEVQ